jgi:hypothetical protein
MCHPQSGICRAPPPRGSLITSNGALNARAYKARSSRGDSSFACTFRSAGPLERAKERSAFTIIHSNDYVSRASPRWAGSWSRCFATKKLARMVCSETLSFHQLSPNTRTATQKYSRCIELVNLPYQNENSDLSQATKEGRVSISRGKRFRRLTRQIPGVLR